MKIAVEGCAHGELDNIYESIKSLESLENVKIDLLICCGDFQAARNEEDLNCMAIPAKYNDIRTFYKYYSGEKVAPYLTIFIGGNHEASNYLQELPYGGWVAPNIYYLGYGNVVNIGGIRIGGLSGIYKGRDYTKGHYEIVPYSEDTKRSVYHVRNLEVFRFKQLKEHVDIFLSHDWPNDVFKHGNMQQLLRYKPFFKDDIEEEKIGSPPCQELLNHLKPTFWFAAHLHCKFAALIPHENDTTTKFLALDKCLPRKRFLQIVDVPHDVNKKLELEYDLEWLTVLHLTNHLLSVKSCYNFMPGPNGNERWDFKPTEEEKKMVLSMFGDSLKIPENFVKTAREFVEDNPVKTAKQPNAMLNPQTQHFCKKLSVDDPLELLLEKSGEKLMPYYISEPIQKPRTSLVLPKPKEDFEDPTISKDSSSSTQSSPKEFDKSDVVITCEEDTTLPSIVPKIRRRNATIYEDE